MIASNRLILTGFYASYFVSFVYLLVTSVMKAPPIAWGRSADVGIAVIIALLGFVIYSRGRGNPRYDAGHRAALNTIPVVLLGMWFLRDVFDFNLLLPGLAWRVFFLLHILPYGAAIQNPGSVND
jgi:hypothetical protein